jgi:RNA polymerase sigma factor (sigma-70 family)
LAVAKIDGRADNAGARVAAVVARHERTLLRVAGQASLCHDDALDAYQRALEIFVRRVETVDPATEVAWLKVVVRHEAMAIRRSRSESVAGDALDLDAFVPAVERTVEDQIAAGERVRRSAEALRALKPDEATALMMKAHGLSYEEIGRRNNWSYTNVMSTIAVFVALGGSSYAALQVDSADIANNSVRGVDVRNRSITERELRRNTLGGRSIRESRLGRVPRARNADRLGGVTAAELVVRCPSGTFAIADVCVETTPRSAAAYGTAVIQCAATDVPAGPGRRLPTHGELLAALSGVQLAPGGELTAEVYPSSTAGQLDVLYVTDQGGSVAVTPNTFAGGKAFRCVADPLN